MVRSYTKTPHASTRGLRLTAFRDGDSTGILVCVRIAPGAAVKNASRASCQLVASNDELLLSNSGDTEKATSRSYWSQFSEVAASAIALPADKPFMIQAEVWQ
jgi:hypothetical protein